METFKENYYFRDEKSTNFKFPVKYIKEVDFRVLASGKVNIIEGKVLQQLGKWITVSPILP